MIFQLPHTLIVDASRLYDRLHAFTTNHPAAANAPTAAADVEEAEQRVRSVLQRIRNTWRRVQAVLHRCVGISILHPFSSSIMLMIFFFFLYTCLYPGLVTSVDRWFSSISASSYQTRSIVDALSKHVTHIPDMLVKVSHLQHICKMKPLLTMIFRSKNECDKVLWLVGF